MRSIQQKLTIFSAVTAVSTLSLTAAQSTPTHGAKTFTDCNVSTYYESLLNSGGSSSWTLDDIETLTIDNHRQFIPSVNANGADIYGALIAVDPGDGPDTVHLVFRNISMAATPYANPDTWSRGDMWPIDRGASRDSPALTDVHFKKPVDSSVLAEWGTLFFGDCGVVQDSALCHNPDEAPQAYTDGKIWTPPDNEKGDIARQLFYGVVRYRQALGLELTDCPPFSESEYGYLSMLLSWHQNDPVDDAEKVRNNQVCTNWQGNRNPFIDYPDLVSQFFGSPDEIMAGTYMYSKCTEATLAPTAAPNGCNSLQPGDVQIILVNSDQPSQIVFYTLASIPTDVEYLYVTNDAWNGTQFAGKEGTARIPIPDETAGVYNQSCLGYCPGTVLSYGFVADENQWEQQSNVTFALNPNGDAILTYCIDGDNNPRFLNGFSYAPGGWAQPDAKYNAEQSVLPSSLINEGSVELQYFKNWIYVGPKIATKAELVSKYFNNPNNYSGNNDVRNTVPALDTSSAEGQRTSMVWMMTTMMGMMGTLFYVL